MGILKDIDVKDLELDLISSNDEDFVSIDGGTLWWTIDLTANWTSNGSEMSCPQVGC